MKKLIILSLLLIFFSCKEELRCFNYFNKECFNECIEKEIEYCLDSYNYSYCSEKYCVLVCEHTVCGE